jgi:hypothetical protein
VCSSHELKIPDEEILGVRDPQRCHAYSKTDCAVLRLADELQPRFHSPTQLATPSGVYKMCARYCGCGTVHTQRMEHHRKTNAMGSPTQKMWITTPITIILKENGNFMALDSGTTMRFMLK